MSVATDVMTTLSRVAYGDELGALDHLDTLERGELRSTAYGLAVMANAILNALVDTTGLDPDTVRDKWLAELTDTARDPSP